MNNKIIGAKGENLAINFLEKKGYKILQQNYVNTIGEIDIIAENKGVLVFIEVKYRASAKFGLPREAVTPHKQNKIRNVALGYIKLHNCFDKPVRFDVVEVLDGNITHIEDAF